MGFPAAANVHIAVGAEQLAALAVKVAGNGDQCHDGAVVLQAVAVVAQGAEDSLQLMRLFSWMSLAASTTLL